MSERAERAGHGRPEDAIHVDVNKLPNDRERGPGKQNRQSEEDRVAAAIADALEKNGDPEVAEIIRKGIRGPETFGDRVKLVWHHKAEVGDLVIFGLVVLVGYIGYSGAAYYMNWAGGVFGKKIDKEMLESTTTTRRRIAA